MKRILAVLTIIVCGLPAAGLAEASKSDGAANAAKACKELRARLGDAAFKATYGTNVNRSNALGKCVSQRADEAEGQDVEDTVNAAKLCKAERKSLGSEAFVKKYGTDANNRNAFGKCVSKTAKTLAGSGGNS